MSTFDLIRGYLGASEDKAVNQQNFQIAALTTGYRNPAWVSKYPIADVSYPVIFNAHLSVYADTSGNPIVVDNGSGGTDGIHAEGGAWGIVSGEQVGGIISIANPAVMDSIAALIKGTVDSFNNIFLELYRVNPDGGATRLTSTNVTSQITNPDGALYVEAILPTPIIVTSGEQYMVAVRNSSTVAAQVSVAGISQILGQDDIGLYFSGGGVKTSYSSAEMTAAANTTDLLPWVQIAARTVTTTPQSWSDDFNRGELGALWALKSTVAENLTLYFASLLCYNGLNTGAQHGIYVRPVSSDSARVEANLYFNLFALSGQKLGVLLHCNRDFTQMVYLGVGGGTARIYSGSYASLTQRASIPWSSMDGLYGLYYDVALDKYVATKDNKLIGLEWAGVGSAVQHGRDYRFGGARIECASLANAGLLDNWTMRDWIPT